MRCRTDSRRKGARGEREACEYLNAYTTLRWERTAQRYGKALADVWVPDHPTLGVHVEVKRRNEGFRRPTSMAKMHSLLETADGLSICLLANFAQALSFRVCPVRTIAFNTVAEFMDQAKRDARAQELPIVLCRMDDEPWVVVWQKVHGRALAAVLGEHLVS